MNSITALRNQLVFLQSILHLQPDNPLTGIILMDPDLKTYMITLPLSISDNEQAEANKICKCFGHEGTALIGANRQLPVYIVVKFFNDTFIAKHFVEDRTLPLEILLKEMVREYTDMREREHMDKLSEHISALGVPGEFLGGIK